jgi:hypothetical protein
VQVTLQGVKQTYAIALHARGGAVLEEDGASGELVAKPEVVYAAYSIHSAIQHNDSEGRGPLLFRSAVGLDDSAGADPARSWGCLFWVGCPAGK